MDQPSGTTTTTTALTWAERTLGERVVFAAWRAVARHLACPVDQTSPSGPGPQRAGQVATGGAGANDGVTDDALLPPAIRDRLR